MTRKTRSSVVWSAAMPMKQGIRSLPDSKRNKKPEVVPGVHDALQAPAQDIVDPRLGGPHGGGCLRLG